MIRNDVAEPQRSAPVGEAFELNPDRVEQWLDGEAHANLVGFRTRTAPVQLDIVEVQRGRRGASRAAEQIDAERFLPPSNPDAARTPSAAPVAEPRKSGLPRSIRCAAGLISEGERSALRERALREALDGRPAAEALRVLESLRAAGSIEESEYAARRSEILGRL